VRGVGHDLEMRAAELYLRLVFIAVFRDFFASLVLCEGDGGLEGVSDLSGLLCQPFARVFVWRAADLPFQRPPGLLLTVDQCCFAKRRISLVSTTKSSPLNIFVRLRCIFQICIVACLLRFG
jgi:hypothetical protein